MDERTEFLIERALDDALQGAFAKTVFLAEIVRCLVARGALEIGDVVGAMWGEQAFIETLRKEDTTDRRLQAVALEDLASWLRGRLALDGHALPQLHAWRLDSSDPSFPEGSANDP